MSTSNNSSASDSSSSDDEDNDKPNNNLSGSSGSDSQSNSDSDSSSGPEQSDDDKSEQEDDEDDKSVSSDHSRSRSPSPSGSSRSESVSAESDQISPSSDSRGGRIARNKEKVVSYKEQDSEDDGDYLTTDEEEEVVEDVDDEEHLETIEKVMDIRVGKKGATGSATTIYAVEERGDPNVLIETDETENQFLIKWVGWSHLHNTWESHATLKETKAKGLKKLDNFCRREGELAKWRRYATPEDVEYFECQLELIQELAKAYLRAERIIEHKAPDGEPEFYVKWECLSYSEATWENGKLIQKRNPEAIEAFRRREASDCMPLGVKSFRMRRKFSQIKSQPDFTKGESGDLELRDYQLDGLNWLVHSWCKENSVILADEMGLGKTIQCICFLSYLFETCQLYGPFLLVVPLSTMTAWQKEFAQWAPQINVVVYLGDVQSRTIIRNHEWSCRDSRNRVKINACLTTYEIVLKDKAFLAAHNWAMLIVDEAHRLKNDESLLYKTLFDFNTNHRLLITGTPLQNSLKELWSLLQFIMPHKFDDWPSFEAEHDNSATKGYSKLHKILEPFILRRVKKDVEKSLPAKVEQILRVEMTSLQKQYYKWILTKNYSALRKGVKGSATTFVNVVMELKKCCNHATLVKPVENAASFDTLTQLLKGSGKLMLLDKLLVRLKETGHRVLIFSQMVRLLDIIAEYLQLRRFAFQRLDGGIKGDIRKQALEHFNAEGSTDFCFLLSTRAGGLGINLATADTVIIFDSDWNPQNDLQAQARAHRIGQKNQVNIYRLVTKNSVEEDIIERAKQKMVLDHLVIQRMDTTGRTVLDKGSMKSGPGQPFNKEELTAILKFGAEELFKEDDSDQEDQCDIDEILRRAETHEEASRPGDDLLNAFKVASFSVNEDEEELAKLTAHANAAVPLPDKDWEQIIPEDLRKKVEAEEREKEIAELYLPPRNRAGIGAMSEGRELGNAALNQKARKKRKRNDSEDSSSDAERPRKRGRPKLFPRDGLGLTDNQIRKFIKAFKRFPRPLARMDLIAREAELEEKSIMELKRLGETLIQKCHEAIQEAKANPVLKEDAPPPPSEITAEDGAGGEGTSKRKKTGPREKGPIFKLAGVPVNARTLSIALEEMQPLGELLPKDESSRKSWKFELHTKNAAFDCEWGAPEDTRLLIGIWEFGMGAWDKIRDYDPILKEKILLEGDKKPQIKHVSTRADYLLRIIKKHVALMEPAGAKARKKRGDKKKDAALLSQGLDGVAPLSENAVTSSTDGGKSKENKPKRARKKKDKGPMHFAAKAEPTPVQVLGDQDPVVFMECKEKMRPVKRSLKALDKADSNMSDKAQVKHTRTCLLDIGDHIQNCLDKYSNEDDQKQWKSHLWYFVSKFTDLDSRRLYKLYRRAKKSNEEKKSDRSIDKKADKDIDTERNRRHDKHRKKDKKKEKDRERETALHPDNSSSSHSQHNEMKNHKGPPAPPYNRDRNNFEARARERERYSSYEGGPTSFNDVNFSSSSSTFGQNARKFANGPSNSDRNDRSFSGQEHYYRERDGYRERPNDSRERDRAPPGRDNKAYYDRERVDRKRQWDSNNRWGGYADGRRPSAGGSATGGYYGGQGQPPGSTANLIGSYASSTASSYPGGRIAPPLTSAEWRRSDPKRQHQLPPERDRDRPVVNNNLARRHESSY